MARGWESKSVEMQMEDRKTAPSVPPGGNAQPDAGRLRQIELLELSRRRLRHELEAVTHDRVRELKLRALAHVEEKLAALIAQTHGSHC